LLRDEESTKLLLVSTLSKSASPLNVRRKKKKANKQTSEAASTRVIIPATQTTTPTRTLSEIVGAEDDVEAQLDTVDIPVVPPAVVSDDVGVILVEAPVSRVDDVPEQVVKPSKAPPAKPSNKKKAKTSGGLSKDVPEIDWLDVVRLPTKSSPSSTASTTSSSSSSQARRSLSPVKSLSMSPSQFNLPNTMAALSINTTMSHHHPSFAASPVPVTTKPLLSRSRSSVADGRSWRDALGPLCPAPISPPALTKTVSLGAAITIYPPLPKDPPPPLSVAPSELAQIVQQIEFYFSDANLQRDLFLRNRMDAQGFVYLNVVLNFNRVKAITQFQKMAVDLPSLIRALEQAPRLTVQCKRLASGAIDPEFARLAKIRPATDWAAWVPSNPLPSNHPFELHANMAQLRRSCSASGFAQTA
ncbi:hypothetical protein DYB26_012024, partial [Aphanomyces astaci]